MDKKFIERMIYMPINYSKIAKDLNDISLEVLRGTLPAVSTTREHLSDSANAPRANKDLLDRKTVVFRDTSSALLDIVKSCTKRIEEKGRSDDNKYYDVCTAVKCLHAINNYAISSVTSVSQPVGIRSSQVSRVATGVKGLTGALSAFERKHKKLFTDKGFTLPLVSLPFPDVTSATVRSDTGLLQDIQAAVTLIENFKR